MPRTPSQTTDAVPAEAAASLDPTEATTPATDADTATATATAEPLDAIEVIKSRSPEGFGFNFKVRASGRMYRFEPIRYPREPRFWCLSVQRCLSNGSPDPDERAWISESLLSREQLADVSRTVRSDVSAWLAEESHDRLRNWLMAGVPVVSDEAAASAANGAA
jgi:hypothetical protein